MKLLQHQIAVYTCGLGILMSFCGISLEAQQPETAPLAANEDQPLAALSLVATPKEQKVKAAYIYNFSRYFEWPDKSFRDENAPFVIGVLGSDPLGNQLDLLAIKKSVRKRKIEIHRFDEMEDFKMCHMLFVTRTVTDEQFQLAVETAVNQHILIVSEKPPATRQGSSVLIFIDENGKVGFEVDVGVVNARHLQVSAKLLKLATVSDSKN